MTNEECVRLLYQYLLGREPDPNGLNHWTAVANQEANIKAVIEGIVQSPEFAARRVSTVRGMDEDTRMDKLPLFISFPRTGSHWINCVMELYFDRPRLREVRTTLLDKTRTDWMWFHDHDLHLTIQHPHTLYLYREPVSTLFSNLVYYSKDPTSDLFKMDPLAASEGRILRFCDDYREHLRKWLLSAFKAHTAVRYDRFRSNREAEFQKICRFFNKPFDAPRVAEVFATVTPEALAKETINPAAIDWHLLTEAYERDRRRFAEKWGGAIRERVITPDLESAFA
jgi:Domain of unknown function (DUF4214)/Sulfotransferase domain